MVAALTGRLAPVLRGESSGKLLFQTFRSTAENVEVAGFSQVEQTKYDLPVSDLMSPLFKAVRIFIKRHVMGVATK